MLPKASAATKSSKSATSSRSARAAADLGLDTPVQFVKGVGPKLGAQLAGRGIATVRELLYFFPRAYEDRTRFSTVSELREGEQATIVVTVLNRRAIPIRSRNTRMLEANCEDATGRVALKWFHFHPSMEASLTPGTELRVTGKPKRYSGRLEILHPEIQRGKGMPAMPTAAAEPDFNTGRVVPVYKELEGIPTRQLRKILWNALERFSGILGEDLPAATLSQHGFPSLPEAIRSIHFPGEGTELQTLAAFRTPAHLRLIYEEFLKFEYLVLRKRLNMAREEAPAVPRAQANPAVADLASALPFKLTGDQKKAVEEVLADLSLSSPMNRLIQGDVGSGKTAVAFLACGAVLAGGGQAVLMAPTEILAEQHYRGCVRLFGGRLRVELLTGKTSASARRELMPKLAAGQPLLLVGTHAVLEEAVVFKNLQLLLVDEQHRFGVDQRRTLRDKGTRPRPGSPGRFEHPHQLVMTATPIPRTLALTAYGDLAVTTIREMPPGRTPVITHVVRQAGRARAYDHVRKELRAGRQAYFIYPLVEESEAEGFEHLQSVQVAGERLAKETFPEFKVGILHGQMRPDEKSAVMQSFARNEIHLLVSTTVVEVGVDVPNATVMVVEHAERFGLSQLHQLRGRVGRGAHASVCLLFAAEHMGETSVQRLKVLEQTQDGFRIAEADLEIRGPGEFLGTRQSGDLPFHMANLVRDQEWLFRARDDAQELLRHDPELEKPVHRPLRSYYEREGKVHFERLKTS
ncbi:MAG: ATP-dependent DNA helicase RecG [Bdellovibrionales bacterium]|nr:ATP-dependent DNA helicase RecG [Bdellovibrionales bacterium]